MTLGTDDRAQAIEFGLGQARSEARRIGETINLSVCLGPPACDNMDGRRGRCPMCEIYLIHPDGEVERPNGQTKQ
jgi:hypothetical protein